MSTAGMKAVILAGGLGKRLRPLTKKVPKPLLPIGNSTAIEICIRGLASHGVREIFIATRFQAKKVKAFLGDGSRYGVKLTYTVEKKPLGTCGPLSLMKNHLKEPFLVMNGDVVTKLDFGDVYRYACEKDADLTVVTKEDVMHYRYGVVRADGDDVTGIDEKPSLSADVLAGVYVMSPRVFDLIPSNRMYGIDQLINDLLVEGRSVARYDTDAYWLDVGELGSFKQANQEYTQHFGKTYNEPARDPAELRRLGLDHAGLDPHAANRRDFAGIPPEAEHRLLSPSAIILALFALATVNYLFKYLVSLGEVQTLMYAKQFAFSDFLPGDWYLNRHQPVRVPFQLLVYPLVKVFPLHVVSMLARLLGYLCVTTALGLIAHRLRINAVYALITLGLFLWLDQSLVPGEEWILKRIESKVFAYALVLFALRALLGRKLWLAGALAGLATTMHILVGLWATIAFGLTVLWLRLAGWRDGAAAVGSWMLTGSFAIYCVFEKLGEPPGPEGFDSAFMWADFRNPHHLYLSYWGFDLDTIIFLGLVVILWITPKVFPGREAYATASRFALATLAPFLVGLVVMALPIGPRVLQYMPFRVADAIVPLIGLLIAVPMLLRLIPHLPVRTLVAAYLVGFCAWEAWQGLERGLGQQDRHPRGGYWDDRRDTRALYNVCDWVKENTPRGTLIVTSPRVDVLTYLCERPVIVTFRDVPSGASDLAEWYNRLVDLNGGEEPEKKGYPARSEIDRNFRRLSESDYLAIGKKYGGRYLLVQDRDRLELNRVYDSGDWDLYFLPYDREAGDREAGSR